MIYKIILYSLLVISYIYALSNIQHKNAEITNKDEIINGLQKEVDKCR